MALKEQVATPEWDRIKGTKRVHLCSTRFLHKTRVFSKDTPTAIKPFLNGTYGKATDHVILPKGLAKFFKLPIFSLQPSSIVAVRKLILT